MACCNPLDPANPLAVGYSVDCCRFQLLDSNGDILCEINLNDANIKQSPSGALILQDYTSTRPFTEGDALNLGFADLAAMEAFIIVSRQACCESDINQPELELVCVEENINLYILDLSTTPPTVTDFDGNDVTGTVTPTVCQDVTFDTEKEFYCVDGVDYTRNDCTKKDKAGVVISVESYWQDITGAIVEAPTGGVITKGACEICNPAIESFYGNNATLTGFNKFTVDIPKCCSVEITTSAGTITLPAKPINWIFCEHFECDLTNYNIAITDGECKPDDIYTILTKTK